MNERIEKLANQLGPVATIGNWGRVEWADNVYPQLGDKMYAAIDLEKFAELIVQECIGILMTPEYPMNHPEELTDYNRGWVNGRLLGIEHLQEHFGVEE